MINVERYTTWSGNETGKGEHLMMRRSFYVLVVCGLILRVASGAPTVSAAQEREATLENESAEDGIRAAIGHYFKGHATGDASHMRKAFLPTAHIEGIRDGKFTSWTLDEYCALFQGAPAVDENTRERRIDLIDASGSSGMAKATLIHGEMVFTDYFVLLKVDGAWKIANKVYYGHRRDSEGR